MTDTTSVSLIAGLRERDPVAWERMVKLYSPLVYSWCRRSGMSSEDASDTLQEILRAAWAGINGFRRDRPEDTFRGWLRIVARNKIRDAFRKKGDQLDAAGGTVAHMQMQAVPELEETPDEVSTETAELFRRAMELVEIEFEEATRKAFWLTAVDGKSPAEVAAQLGLTPGAVRQAKYKVLRRLRQALGDED